MVIDASQLLRKLEPPVRPVTAPARAGAAGAALENLGFDRLLALVSDGKIRSDRPVTVDERAELTEELDDKQRERLASAADLATASGARRAVMLIDGRGLVLDVDHRVITAELSTGEDDRIVELDAAVFVADPAAHPTTAAPGPPGTGVVPPGIARQLAAAQQESRIAPDNH